MVRSLLPMTAAALALAACNPSPATDAPVESSDTVQAEADANAVAPVDGTPVGNSGTEAPLDKQQALALMKQRHEDYEEIGDAMKAITKELRGDNPDLAAIRDRAAFIAGIAPQVKSWFPQGTGPDVGKTEAKAAIWENKPDFLAKAAAFERSATAFKQAADGGDLAAIRAAQADLGKSCKACHDLYREEH